MEQSTKERILDVALELFSQRGYEGTTLRDLAAELGLSKSALYKHYISKENIWESLIGTVESHYANHIGIAGRMTIPTSVEELQALSMRQVDFTIHDERIIKARKLFAVEQYRNDRMAALATRHFLTDMETLYTDIFAGMMENGSIKKDDPQQLALSYTAPVAALIHMCDREPKREAEAMERIHRFIVWFTMNL